MLQYIVDNCDARTLVIGSEYRRPARSRSLPTFRSSRPSSSRTPTTSTSISRSGSWRGGEFLDGASPATDLEGPELLRRRQHHLHVRDDRTVEGCARPVARAVLVRRRPGRRADAGRRAVRVPSAVPRVREAEPVSHREAQHSPGDPRRASASASSGTTSAGTTATAVGLLGPLARLLMLNPEQPDDADNPVTRATCGPLFPEVDDFKKRFGLELGTGYGMTEIGAVTAHRGHTHRGLAQLRQGAPRTSRLRAAGRRRSRRSRWGPESSAS